MTTLPFNDVQLPVDVDLSQLDMAVFPDFRTVFIYLRNVGYPTEQVNLDFSKLSYQDKVNMLLEFAFGDIVFRCKELESTWVQALELHYKPVSYVKGIFDFADLNRFLKEQKADIEEAASFCRSSIWNAADLAVKNSKQLHIGTPLFNSETDRNCSQNLWNLFYAYKEELDFLTFNNDIELKRYSSFNNGDFLQQAQMLLKLQSIVFAYGCRTATWNLFQQCCQILNDQK